MTKYAYPGLFGFFDRTLSSVKYNYGQTLAKLSRNRLLSDGFGSTEINKPIAIKKLRSIIKQILISIVNNCVSQQYTQRGHKAIVGLHDVSGQEKYEDFYVQLHDQGYM